MGCSILFLFTKGHALSDHISRPQILIGGHLKKHWFKGMLVYLSFWSKHCFLRICMIDGAYKTLKTLRLVDIFHAALHHHRSVIDHGR